MVHLGYTTGKLRSWTPKSWRLLVEDDFADDNRVIFRFHVIFLGSSFTDVRCWFLFWLFGFPSPRKMIKNHGFHCFFFWFFYSNFWVIFCCSKCFFHQNGQTLNMTRSFFCCFVGANNFLSHNTETFFAIKHINVIFGESLDFFAGLKKLAWRCILSLCDILNLETFVPSPMLKPWTSLKVLEEVL